MSTIKKSVRRAVSRSSDQVKRAGKVAGSVTAAAAKAGARASKRAAVTTLETGPRGAMPVEVAKEPKERGRTAQRKRLRDKIDEVVAGAAVMNSAVIATARASRKP